jgi:hypothetical protein
MGSFTEVLNLCLEMKVGFLMFMFPLDVCFDVPIPGDVSMSHPLTFKWSGGRWGIKVSLQLTITPMKEVN